MDEDEGIDFDASQQLFDPITTKIWATYNHTTELTQDDTTDAHMLFESDHSPVTPEPSASESEEEEEERVGESALPRVKAEPIDDSVNQHEKGDGGDGEMSHLSKEVAGLLFKNEPADEVVDAGVAEDVKPTLAELRAINPPIPPPQPLPEKLPQPQVKRVPKGGRKPRPAFIFCKLCQENQKGSDTKSERFDPTSREDLINHSADHAIQMGFALEDALFCCFPDMNPDANTVPSTDVIDPNPPCIEPQIFASPPCPASEPQLFETDTRPPKPSSPPKPKPTREDPEGVPSSQKKTGRRSSPKPKPPIEDPECIPSSPKKTGRRNRVAQKMTDINTEIKTEMVDSLPISDDEEQKESNNSDSSYTPEPSYSTKKKKRGRKRKQVRSEDVLAKVLETVGTRPEETPEIIRPHRLIKQILHLKAILFSKTTLYPPTYPQIQCAHKDCGKILSIDSGDLTVQTHLLSHYPKKLLKCVLCGERMVCVGEHFRDQHPTTKRIDQSNLIDERHLHESQLLDLFQYCFPNRPTNADSIINASPTREKSPPPRQQTHISPPRRDRTVEKIRTPPGYKRAPGRTVQALKESTSIRDSGPRKSNGKLVVGKKRIGPIDLNQSSNPNTSGTELKSKKVTEQVQAEKIPSGPPGIPTPDNKEMDRLFTYGTVIFRRSENTKPLRCSQCKHMVFSNRFLMTDIYHHINAHLDFDTPKNTPFFHCVECNSKALTVLDIRRHMVGHLESNDNTDAVRGDAECRGFHLNVVIFCFEPDDYDWMKMIGEEEPLQRMRVDRDKPKKSNKLYPRDRDPPTADNTPKPSLQETTVTDKTETGPETKSMPNKNQQETMSSMESHPPLSSVSTKTCIVTVSLPVDTKSTTEDMIDCVGVSDMEVDEGIGLTEDMTPLPVDAKIETLTATTLVTKRFPAQDLDSSLNIVID